MTILVDALLNKKGSKRPNINVLLQFPAIAERIDHLLDEEVFKEEFSHSILHGYDIMRELKLKRKKTQTKAIEQRMGNLKIGDYTPKTVDTETFKQNYQVFMESVFAGG